MMAADSNKCDNVVPKDSENSKVLLSQYASSLEEHVKKRYIEKTSSIGIDLWLIPKAKLDPDCLLPLEACDLLSYVVLETSFYTNKQFKAYSHWVCVSSIGYQNDEIKIYDSLYNNVISNEVEQQIECMLGGAPFRMMVASVQQPQNGSNCGIFAIAFATCLTFRQDPSFVEFNVSQMRKHLLGCIQSGNMELFPTVS